MRGESAGLAAGSRDTMAGNEDRGRILSHGLADLLSRIGAADRFGDFAIGARLSRGNFASGFVHLAEKRSHIAQIHGHAAKVLNFSTQVKPDSFGDCCDLRRKHARPVSAGLASNAGFRGSASGFRKLNRRDDGSRPFAPGNAAGAERSLKQAITGWLYGQAVSPGFGPGVSPGHSLGVMPGAPHWLWEHRKRA